MAAATQDDFAWNRFDRMVYVTGRERTCAYAARELARLHKQTDTPNMR